MVSAAATRTFRWAGSLWLAAIAAWYAWTAISSIRHPLNAGSDAKWAIGILLSCAAAAAWHVLWRDRRAAVVWWALLGLAAAAMAVASGQLRPVLSFLWILAIACAAGARLLRLFGAPLPRPVAESVVFALPSGILLLGLVSLLLAAAGLLAPAWILAILAVLTLLEAPALRRFLRKPAVRPQRPADSAERAALLAVCGVVGLINLAWALAPEIHYDALNYHLAVPRAFLESGRAVDLPYFWHSYFAQMMESLFAVCLAVGGPVAAKLMSFAIGIGAALAVSALGRLLFGGRAGLWAGALFYATPMTAWLSTTTYTDHATALFLTASLLAFLHWRRLSGSGWLYAFGWLAGGALAVKATAAYGLVVLAGVLLVDFFRGRARFSALLRCAILAAAAALPWYALRFAFTGNPFYPLGNALFPGARAVPAGFDARSIVGEGYGKTGWKGLLEVPFRLTFETDRFGEPLSRRSHGNRPRDRHSPGARPSRAAREGARGDAPGARRLSRYRLPRGISLSADCGTGFRFSRSRRSWRSERWKSSRRPGGGGPFISPSWEPCWRRRLLSFRSCSGTSRSASRLPARSGGKARRSFSPARSLRIPPSRT